MPLKSYYVEVKENRVAGVLHVGCAKAHNKSIASQQAIASGSLYRKTTQRATARRLIGGEWMSVLFPPLEKVEIPFAGTKYVQ